MNNAGKRTVFTNGCFDILHSGHIDLLERAKALGDYLIVGINSDDSIRQIKGIDRPFIDQSNRRKMLLALKSVDEVRIFDEPTPENLIGEIKPDILIKGGDWQIKEIIGAEFVRQNGGAVYSLPLLKDFSSSKIVEHIRNGKDSPNGGQNKESDKTTDTAELIRQSLAMRREIFQAVFENQIELIEKCAEIIVETFLNGNKILVCGNGGSAADAQHLAAEFVGRYETERRALPAIALTTDTSALTAIGNDYGFEKIFARQVEALAATGDCLIAISTSGNSPNVLAAVLKAREMNCKIIGLTGGKGKKLAALCDASLLIPAEKTSRVQEAHITIAHIWCEIVDVSFAANEN